VFLQRFDLLLYQGRLVPDSLAPPRPLWTTQKKAPLAGRAPEASQLPVRLKSAGQSGPLCSSREPARRSHHQCYSLLCPPTHHFATRTPLLLKRIWPPSCHLALLHGPHHFTTLRPSIALLPWCSCSRFRISALLTFPPSSFCFHQTFLYAAGPALWKASCRVYQGAFSLSSD
jgi:hypothetical protein